jgi:hypothetical protein
LPPPVSRGFAVEFPAGARYLKSVGKTYVFECSYCQYRAKISGGPDGGLHCVIQTIICRDCRELYDVFVRQRRRADAAKLVKFPGFYRPEIPPVVLRQSSLNPPAKPLAPLVWYDSERLACPVESKHPVEPWNDPGRCPRCGNFMEKNGFPYRTWE